MSLARIIFSRIFEIDGSKFIEGYGFLAILDLCRSFGIVMIIALFHEYLLPMTDRTTSDSNFTIFYWLKLSYVLHIAQNYCM